MEQLQSRGGEGGRGREESDTSLEIRRGPGEEGLLGTAGMPLPQLYHSV